MKCGEPKGAFYAFPEIRSFGLTSAEFCNALLERYRVVCIPGNALGDCGEGHIRISYTCGEAQLREALERMQLFCAEL